MTPERRQQIDQLFHAALACEPAQRAAFLASACAGDESLRLEVESLISSHEQNVPAEDTAERMPGAREIAFEQAGDTQISKPVNAYQAYQLSRYYFHKVSFPDLSKSRFWLEEAVRLDADFAPAYAALAEQLVMEAITGLHSPAESFPAAREALLRAGELNLDSAEFYAVGGLIALVCDWNFKEAETSLRESIKLNSHHAFANVYLGQVLMFQSRSREAEACLRRAQEILPLGLHNRIILTISYFLARNYQKVVEECEKLLAVYPRFPVAVGYRCLALEQMGRAAEAVVEYEDILGEPGGEVVRRWVGYAYALLGDRENALKTIDKLDVERCAHYLSPTHQAVVYAALREVDTALSYLETALAEQDPWMLWIGTDPRLDNLRSDPRFDELVRRVGLKSKTPTATRMSQFQTTAKMIAVKSEDSGKEILPERWQQIDHLFHASLARFPAERAAFLASACAGDEPLRLEVESLIASHEQGDSFIETPAGDIAAELLGADQPSLAPGQQIENYRIVRQLGSGGMGEVYLADDTRLKRKIALKLLPAHFTVNPDRVRRFKREARAASALNHPNIVTIYEIGEDESAHFIATEFVDGKTLRQLINEKPLTLSEALNVAVQVAGALTGAHAAGIVHRDIKPENIMVRADGYVKILDFGLAKLSELQTTDSDLETPTLLQSNPGLVMGTVQYMSPEQARGKKVDVRTDIWSLGVVLYELLSGRVPFSGETPSHVMVSLMEDQLPPLTGYGNVPPELDRIVTKALRKNQKERYQTASQLALDLKNLKRDLQLEARLKGLLEAVPSGKPGTMSDGQALRTGASVTRTNDIAVTHPTSSAEYRAGKMMGSKRAWALVLALFLLFGVAGFGLYSFARRNRSAAKPPEAFQNIEFTRLTNTGKAKAAVISPDGKYVAYVAEDGGRESVWLKQIPSSNNVEIVPPAEKEFFGATFSHDSSHLYYVLRERNNSIGVLHRVSVFGGVSAKLIVDVDSPISLSPDGKQFAFVRGSSGGKRALMLANADGSEERELASGTGPDAFSFGGPAWLPDGKSIACGAGKIDQTGPYTSVVAVEVADGSVKPLTTQKWREIGRLAWLRDGSGLILSATDHGRRSPFQLWYLSYPDGEARRITRDLQDYDSVSLTSDSTALVSNQKQTISGIWNAPDDDANRAKQILSNKYDGDGYGYYSRFSWTPNGQIIYTSPTHGTPSIWVMSDQGTGNKQLTPELTNNHFPSVTSDARYVVFLSDRTGSMNVWRMDPDGNNEKQLTKGRDDSWPWCSPDGQWVVYHSLVLGKRALHRVSINGGDSEQLTDYSSVCPAISPDGAWISGYYRSEAKAPWKLAIIPFDGGPPVRTFEVPENVVFASLVRWTPDGRALAYITSRDGISNIWIQPLDGRQPKQLTDFNSDQIFWFDWSPDGRQLGVSRGAVTSDVVLIRNLG